MRRKKGRGDKELKRKEMKQCHESKTRKRERERERERERKRRRKMTTKRSRRRRRRASMRREQADSIHDPKGNQAKHKSENQPAP